MKYRRRKCKRNVRCTICTDHRWLGNNTGRFKRKEEELKKIHRKEIEDARNVGP